MNIVMRATRSVSAFRLNGSSLETSLLLHESFRLLERTFQMNSERCWRLGLIVSELITNAERHAFRNGGGLIRVELLPSLSARRMPSNGQRHEQNKYLSRART